MRRLIDGARRHHEDEIHAAGAEINVAQIEDAQVDVASDDVDRDRVADPKPHAAGEIARERDQARTAIIGRPPAGAFHDPRFFRPGAGVGDGAVSIHRPA